MTRSLIMGSCIWILILGSACGTSASPDTSADASGNNNDTTAMVQQPGTSEEKREAKLIPSDLFSGKLDANDKVTYVVQTDTTALLRIERGEKGKVSLQMAVEKISDEAKLKRAMQAWAYHPDIKESFAAGDEALLTYTVEKRKKYYTVVFRAGQFFATLTNDIQNGQSETEGILFSAAALKQLASDWGSHLKSLQK